MVAKLKPFAAPALCALAMAFVAYAGWLGHTVAGPTEWTITTLVAALAVATGLVLRRGSAVGRTAVGASLMAGMLGFVVIRLAGVELFDFQPWHDSRYALFFASLLALTVLGLARRWFFARWLALALAGAGVASAGLNLLAWSTTPSQYTWMLAVQIAGALLVLATLVGPNMQQHFARGAGELWSSSDPLLRSLRWTIITHFAAIPMLLVYAWMQPIVPATATSAVVLAFALSLGVSLAVARKVLGAIVLVLGGAGMLIHTAATLTGAFAIGDGASGSIAIYYAMFWTPSALAALVCGARLAGPVLRLLRSRI